MNNTPDNLNLGHAIAYVFLYIAKFNDGEPTTEEYQEILKSMGYWMGAETNHDELKEILIDTDEWFNSGSNFEQSEMLERIIDLIKKYTNSNQSVLNEIFEDCIRLSAANDIKYQILFSSEENINREDLIHQLFNDYPILQKLYEKLMS